MDLVANLVHPGSKPGERPDIEQQFPATIITARIAPENVHRLIAPIRSAA